MEEFDEKTFNKVYKTLTKAEKKGELLCARRAEHTLIRDIQIETKAAEELSLHLADAQIEAEQLRRTVKHLHTMIKTGFKNGVTCGWHAPDNLSCDELWQRSEIKKQLQEMDHG